MDSKNKNADEQQTGKPLVSGEQGRAKAGHGSTTQGGENFGQGSSQLDKDSLEQGSESNDGSNYDKGLNE